MKKYAKEDDSIIDICSVRNGKRITVYPPKPILKRQDLGHWTRFYYEDVDDVVGLSWTEFSKKLKKLGITNIKQGNCKDISKQADLIDTIWEG